MRILLMRLVFVGGVLGLWEYASGRWFSAFFVSSPSEVFESLWKIVADGTLFFHMGITALEAGIGFLIGGTAGAVVGLFLARSELLNQILSPFITAFYSIPKVALAPLFIMWFGVGFQMKVLFSALIVFFLVFLNTYTGVRNVSRELIAIFRLMGARERDLMFQVILPSAVVWIFAGLRLSVPYALIGAVVGEILASNKGLGFLVEHSASSFDTAGVFAALIGIVTLALLLNWAVHLAERLFMPWNRAQASQEITV